MDAVPPEVLLMVEEVVLVHPLASVTVTLKVPDGRPVTLDAVELPALFHR